MDNNYRVTIKETSDELSPIEKVKYKDTTDCVRLDLLLEQEKSVIIKPKKFVVLDIHNDKSEDKDYPNYIIVDDTDTKYITGSATFFNTFINIYNELKDYQGDWNLKIYKVDSKNYKGKQFITCSVA